MDDLENMDLDAVEKTDSEKDIEEQLPEEVDQEEELSKGGSQSWLITVLVGLVMLLAGLLLGYFGRGEFGPEAQAAKSTATAQMVAAATQAAANAEQSATQAAANAELMDFLTQNTRHYKGDPNAPVTIIEFSDFQ
jgi:flagellar basal body-associated protein FliL